MPESKRGVCYFSLIPPSTNKTAAVDQSAGAEIYGFNFITFAGAETRGPAAVTDVR